MRRKLLIAGALLVTSACSAEPNPQAPISAGASEERRIDCALGGAPRFARDCVVERAERDGVPLLVVRHPAGGFRRFEVLKDGRGLAVADGAQLARTAMAGKLLEVAVGADRYRFPARQGGVAGR